MGFYQQFSKYYNDIFPIGDNQVNFIQSYINQGSSILDIACATGGYSIALAQRGYNVYGVDLDEAMIDIAKDKAGSLGIKVDFRSGDMKKVDSIYDLGFDGAMCIGNSLVHLDGPEDIKLGLQSFNKVLKNEGILVIQNINYDRILDKNVQQLPTIENKQRNIKFIRKYTPLEDSHRIAFDTSLVLEDGTVLNNSVNLYPLRQQEMDRLLREAGFEPIGYYGSFNRQDKFTEESYALVVVAKKITV